MSSAQPAAATALSHIAWKKFNSFATYYVAFPGAIFHLKKRRMKYSEMSSYSVTEIPLMSWHKSLQHFVSVKFEDVKSVN